MISIRRNDVSLKFLMRREQVLTFLQYKVFIFQHPSASRLLIVYQF